MAHGVTSGRFDGFDAHVHVADWSAFEQGSVAGAKNAGAALGVVGRRIEGNSKRIPEFVETQGDATGT